MKTKKVEKPVANIHGKTEYVIHKRNLKQTLNPGLVLKQVHKVITFNQNTWLKPCIFINVDPRKKTKKIILKITFLSWWIMLLLENARKMWENIEILNLPQEKEPNYHNTKFFTEKLLAVKMKKQRWL